MKDPILGSFFRIELLKTTAALSRLKIMLRDKYISLASVVKLMRTLILSTFLYACESWTLTAELEGRCCQRLLYISYTDHAPNEEIRSRIQDTTGVYDDLLSKGERAETHVV